MKKKVVVLTGAGVSAESGLRTFRDTNGLWEEYHVEDVATYDGWLRNPEMVLDFYNKRRSQLLTAQPNDAHKALVRLEEKFDVTIITQNVDDLHERAGSSNVLHLHGELTKVRSVGNPKLIYSIGYDEIKLGDKCEEGQQLRPHIVWFGEAVPLIESAAEIVSYADYLLIIGTSLQVYPAAGLMHYAPAHSIKYLVDPNASYYASVNVIRDMAGKAVPILVNSLLDEITV